MRLTCTFLILFYLGISLTSCSQSNRDKVTIPNTKTIEIDTSSIAVISFDQQGNWPFDNSYKPISLTESEIFEIETLMKACVLDYNKSLEENLKESYSIDFKRYKYKRQYVAVLNNKGEKEIWVNAFCSTWDTRWKNEILLVHDGGNCYFNLKINLTTKKCFEIAVNGYA